MSAFDSKNIFHGQVVVFTGKMASLSRPEAHDLVKKLGGQATDRVTKSTTCLVIGEEGYVSDIVKSNKLKKAESMNAAGGNIRIIPESEFLQMAGLETKASLERKFYSLERIQRLFPNLKTDRIRYFAHWGIFKPAVRTNAHQYYEFRDLLIFRQISELLEQEMSLREIANRVRPDRVPSQQLAIDFEEHKPKGVVLPLQTTKAEPARTAAEWYEIGYRADGNPEHYAEAVAAYENALAVDPEYVDAMINLANIRFHQNEPGKAINLLERAFAIDSHNYLVCYNLANLYDEMGENEKAISFYQQALSVFPDYEPAIFNLAVAFEKIGWIDKAQQNWKKYLEIEPEGEWAAIAREHLSSS